MEMMTMEQFKELKGAMDNAQTDDTPFISTTEDEIHVFGDPNKTEIKSADYTVLFAFPDTQEWRARIKTVGDEIVKEVKGYVVVERHFKDVYLSPRNMSNAITAMTLIEQFLFDITENGEVKALSYEQMIDVFKMMYKDINEAVYELVGVVLNIPQREWEWMLPINAIENAIQIVMNNPSVVNEADLFFGSSLNNL